MNQNNFFFEDEEYDIPFYRKKPRLTGKNLTILLVGFLIAVLTPFIMPEEEHLLLNLPIL